MTESTKSNELSDKEALRQEKQKTKVLKNGLKDERKARELLEQDLKVMMTKCEQLQATI